VKTCPRCQAKDQDSFHFCKECGYKFFGPSFGLVQYVPHQRKVRQNSKELFRAEVSTTEESPLYNRIVQRAGSEPDYRRSIGLEK
jgi:hypothetical protein